MKLSAILASLSGDETGAAAIEYALLVSLISLAGITWYSVIGASLSSTFATIAASL
jgi:Flp pilus assembly pilin Flp